MKTIYPHKTFCLTDRQVRREAIAQAFKEAHCYDVEAWPDILNNIYWNLIGGVYGEVSVNDMGNNVTNYTVEISGSRSKTGNPIIFDIDIDSYLIIDIKG